MIGALADAVVPADPARRLRPVLLVEGSRIEGLMIGPRRRAITD
ncbi:MAG: hypothetical protein K0Q62_1424 [Phenylobacterium sp.]|jgi:hypothetical protein|nr:hypothetical protein [Phenylobacterium sp.]